MKHKFRTGDLDFAAIVMQKTGVPPKELEPLKGIKNHLSFVFHFELETRQMEKVDKLKRQYYNMVSMSIDVMSYMLTRNSIKSRIKQRILDKNPNDTPQTSSFRSYLKILLKRFAMTAFALLVLPVIVASAYTIGPPDDNSYYNKYTKELYIRPGASTWEADHEVCHAIYHEILTQSQRNLWLFMTKDKSRANCYTEYPFRWNGVIYQEECFAEVCAYWSYLRRDDGEEGLWLLQAGSSYINEAWEYRFVSRTFDKILSKER